MRKQILDFIYKKRKDHPEEVYKILKILKVYDNPLDKEVVLMLNALNPSISLYNVYISELLALLLPMNPYEWITSKNPMMTFATMSGRRKIGTEITVGEIYDPLCNLVEIYQEHGSVYNFCKKQLPKHPQHSIHDVLYKDKGLVGYNHIGLERAIMLLTRTDKAAVGLWDLIPLNKLKVPLNKYIRSSAVSIGLTTKGSKDVEADIHKWLSMFDKKDPLKYMLVLELGNYRSQLNKMGYTIVY